MAIKLKELKFCVNEDEYRELQDIKTYEDALKGCNIPFTKVTYTYGLDIYTYSKYLQLLVENNISKIEGTYRTNKFLHSPLVWKFTFEFNDIDRASNRRRYTEHSFNEFTNNDDVYDEMFKAIKAHQEESNDDIILIEDLHHTGADIEEYYDVTATLEVGIKVGNRVYPRIAFEYYNIEEIKDILKIIKGKKLIELYRLIRKNKLPKFTRIEENDVNDIIAYLNTLNEWEIKQQNTTIE